MYILTHLSFYLRNYYHFSYQFLPLSFNLYLPDFFLCFVLLFSVLYTDGLFPTHWFLLTIRTFLSILNSPIIKI
jgi:hypothetical protein